MPLKHVQKSFDNTFKFQISHDGTPLDMAAVSRMVMTFDNSDIVADSAVDPALISWQGQTLGEVLFSVNDLAINGGQRIELIMYDFGHTGGQKVISTDTHNLVLNFT